MEHLSEIQIDRIITRHQITIYIGTLLNKPIIAILPASSFPMDLPPNHLASRAIPRLENTGIIQLDIPTEINFIYPASANHLSKFTTKFNYISESYNDYLNNADFLSTSWIDTLMESKENHEEIIFDADNYFVIGDNKWDRNDISSLYYLLIFKNQKYRSLREIESADILIQAKQDALKLCELAGLNEKDLCLYFHYRPSYFRLHMHIVNISKSKGFLGFATRNVLLDDAIRNIKKDKEYYKKDLYFIGFTK